MNDLEKLYIEVELGVTPFSELGNTASEHLFSEGIECEDYEKCGKLKHLLDTSKCDEDGWLFLGSKY